MVIENSYRNISRLIKESRIYQSISSLQNTKKIFFFLLTLLIIFIGIDSAFNDSKFTNLFRNEFRIQEEPNLELTSNPDNVPWDIAIEPGTNIGNELVQTEFFDIQYSTFLSKYVVTIKSGEDFELDDITARIYIELTKFSEFENGIDETKVLIIDQRENYTEEGNLENKAAPFI